MESEQKPGGRLVVQDAATMRALAHPARITSLERLMRGGPATATELAEVAGLTPSAMSYHLRHLKRAGLITAAPGRGDGRERLWQAERTGGWSHDSTDDDSPEARAVSADLLRSVIAAQDLRLARWLGSADHGEHRDEGFFAETVILATTAEMTALHARIDELLQRFAPGNRRDPPADAITRRASFRSFPDGEGLPDKT